MSEDNIQVPPEGATHYMEANEDYVFTWFKKHNGFWFGKCNNMDWNENAGYNYESDIKPITKNLLHESAQEVYDMLQEYLDGGKLHRGDVERLLAKVRGE